MSSTKHIFKGDASRAACALVTWLHPTHGQPDGLPPIWTVSVLYQGWMDPDWMDHPIMDVDNTPELSDENMALYEAKEVSRIALDVMRTYRDKNRDTSINFLVCLAWGSPGEKTYVTTPSIVGARSRDIAVRTLKAMCEREGTANRKTPVSFSWCASLDELETTFEIQRRRDL